VAGRTSLGWCTPGAAPSLYDAGLGADIVWGSKPASASMGAYSHAHLLSAPFFAYGLFVHKRLMLAPIEVSLSHYLGRKKLC
jgi:hypothetical protein